MLKKLPLQLALVIIAMTFQLGCGSGTGKSEASNPSEPRIQPSPPIAVLQANSPEEKAYLEDAFVGVTTDGFAEPGLFPIQSTGLSTGPMLEAVNSFLSSLSEQQRAKCTFPVDDDEWRRWHNIDFYEREGIALFEMNEQQLELAFEVLETALSADGLSKSKNIMAMEGYLKEISIRLGSRNEEQIALLGDDKYWFTFMGTPSHTEPWGWQLDGHHLIINYFVLGDQVVMTPTFMGSELTFIEEGPNAGTRTFVEEGKKGLALYRSLEGQQRALATLLEEKKYGYSRTEGFRDNEVVPYAGVPVIGFSDQQRSLLIDLIEEYIGTMKDDRARVRMDEILAQLDYTWFAWVGGSGDEDVFYYRIHSPVVLIEYDHHAPVFVVKKGEVNSGPVNWHVHTVVRTPNGNDYGKDLLRQHLKSHHKDGHSHE